jgi:hypothetical protein
MPTNGDIEIAVNDIYPNTGEADGVELRPTLSYKPSLARRIRDQKKLNSPSTEPQLDSN